MISSPRSMRSPGASADFGKLDSQVAEVSAATVAHAVPSGAAQPAIKGAQ